MPVGVGLGEAGGAPLPVLLRLALALAAGRVVAAEAGAAGGGGTLAPAGQMLVQHQLVAALLHHRLPFHTHSVGDISVVQSFMFVFRIRFSLDISKLISVSDKSRAEPWSPGLMNSF